MALEGLRVGFYAHDGVWPVTESTRVAVERAAALLAAAGCAVEEAAPPDVAEATDLFFALMAADGGARARADVAAAGGVHTPAFAALLESIRPLAVDAAGFFALVRRLFSFRARVRAFVGRFGVLLAPVTAGPAPPHGCRPGDEAALDEYLPFNYTHAFSLAGLPVSVVRAGEERGLPLGVQVVAPAFRDHVALAVAGAVESGLGDASAQRGRGRGRRHPHDRRAARRGRPQALRRGPRPLRTPA